MSISINTVSRWFSMVRDAAPENRDRVLECFWDTQLSAKEWLVNHLVGYMSRDESVYIFGGWYGVLASMLEDRAGMMIDHVYSLDIDPGCEIFGSRLKSDRIDFITADMGDYEYPWEQTPTVVINTSSEHVEQGVYDTWYDRIPHGTTVVVQSNNFYSCTEHVRCASNLREFKVLNHAVNTLYEGELHNDQYTRYMAIWRK